LDIALSSVQVIELFFRFCAVGQLGLLIFFLVKKYPSLPLAQVGLTVCLISYILLTAPIENHHYGSLRNILLLATDLTPFAALWFTLDKLEKNFKLREQPKWLLVLFAMWLITLFYVFLILNGRSLLHDVNHGVGIAVLLWAIYLCLFEYMDDLDNRRRNTRLLMVAFCCFYMVGLVSFEFVYQNIRDTSIFGLTNAFIIFLLVNVISSKLISPESQVINSVINPQNTYEPLPAKNRSRETIESLQLTALNKLMIDGVFLQQELTIGKLSTMLTLPPHQLRQLINQQLGFSNFSHYLNSYRIPWVCEQLQDVSKKHLPILTLALESGYGSIAPFNRAFKAKTGKTPKQYRDQF
jgi:AraC-like DNA-binding protein